MQSIDYMLKLISITQMITIFKDTCHITLARLRWDFPALLIAGWPLAKNTAQTQTKEVCQKKIT